MSDEPWGRKIIVVTHVEGDVPSPQRIADAISTEITKLAPGIRMAGVIVDELPDKPGQGGSQGATRAYIGYKAHDVASFAQQVEERAAAGSVKQLRNACARCMAAVSEVWQSIERLEELEHEAPRGPKPEAAPPSSSEAGALPASHHASGAGMRAMPDEPWGREITMVVYVEGDVPPTERIAGVMSTEIRKIAPRVRMVGVTGDEIQDEPGHEGPTR